MDCHYYLCYGVTYNMQKEDFFCFYILKHDITCMKKKMWYIFMFSIIIYVSSDCKWLSFLGKLYGDINTVS